MVPPRSHISLQCHHGVTAVNSNMVNHQCDTTREKNVTGDSWITDHRLPPRWSVMVTSFSALILRHNNTQSVESWDWTEFANSACKSWTYLRTVYVRLTCELCMQSWTYLWTYPDLLHAVFASKYHTYMRSSHVSPGFTCDVRQAIQEFQMDQSEARISLAEFASKSWTYMLLTLHVSPGLTCELCRWWHQQQQHHGG